MLNSTRYFLVILTISVSFLLGCGGSNSSSEPGPSPIDSGNTGDAGNQEDGGQPADDAEPLEVQIQFAEQRYEVNDTISFSSNVSGGVPPYEYSWTIDGTSLSTDSAFETELDDAKRIQVELAIVDAEQNSVVVENFVDVFFEGNVSIKLLGFNDFHGQLSPLSSGNGGSYKLASHLMATAETARDAVFMLHGGDHVGASPANSALLQDEPAVEFLNILADEFCPESSSHFTCQVIGTAGNHEFDEGSDELLRLVNGGNHENGPFIEDPWHGAKYLTLSANVRKSDNSGLLLPPYVVHEVAGIEVAFVGITLDYTPDIVVPGIVEDLRFVDQNEAADEIVEELQSQGIESIVFLVHDGVSASAYSGPTYTAPLSSNNDFRQFVADLPSAVDVVIAGHTHGFTNEFIANSEQQDHLILATQAYSKGLSYTDIDIEIDTETGDIVSKSAQVFTTDDTHNLILSERAQQVLNTIAGLEDAANDIVADRSNTVIGEYVAEANQISLAEFIADAHRYSLAADIGVTNSGGIRGSLQEGDVTWGDLFTIQPWQNDVVKRTYTGEDIIALIDRGGQSLWSSNLNISAGRYSIDGELIEEESEYTLAGNSYVMNAEPFSLGSNPVIGLKDIETLVEYIQALPTPFSLNSEPTD